MTDPSNNGRSSENSEMRRCQKLHDRFRESQSNRCRETQSNRCSLPDASTLTLDSRLHVYPGMSIPIGLDESELPSDLPDSTDVQPFSNGRRPSKAPASFPAGPYLLSTIVHGEEHFILMLYYRYYFVNETIYTPKMVWLNGLQDISHHRRFAPVAVTTCPSLRRFAALWDFSHPRKTFRPLCETFRPLLRRFAPYRDVSPPRGDVSPTGKDVSPPL